MLSNSQAGQGRTVKQEQEEISRNHVQALFPGLACVPHWADNIVAKVAKEGRKGKSGICPFNEVLAGDKGDVDGAKGTCRGASCSADECYDSLYHG